MAFVVDCQGAREDAHSTLPTQTELLAPYYGDWYTKHFYEKSFLLVYFLTNLVVGNKFDLVTNLVW